MLYTTLYRNLFGHLQDNDAASALKKVAAEHPYFSLAHFFALQQAGKADIDYSQIAGKAALHFNDPYFLHFQLTRKEKSTFAEQNILQETALQPVQNDNNYLPQAEIENTQPDKAALKRDEEPLLFEPLYTTDYFASQGIKLGEEQQPADKLGKQLKSFTAWLKTMKKLHDDKLPAGNDQMDLAVNKLAEQSNTGQEILTEAMAEAFLQQGKKQKARDIYFKLSLLNPSKNAYFAAKSEQIN